MKERIMLLLAEAALCFSMAGTVFADRVSSGELYRVNQNSFSGEGKTTVFLAIVSMSVTTSIQRKQACIGYVRETASAFLLR